MTEDDARLRAIINESKRNNVANPAVAADLQYKPHHWTPAEEAELVQKLHGTDAERLDALIAENNERIRRT